MMSMHVIYKQYAALKDRLLADLCHLSEFG